MIAYLELMLINEVILQRRDLAMANSAFNLITDEFTQAMECSMMACQIAAVASLAMTGCCSPANYLLYITRITILRVRLNNGKYFIVVNHLKN